jgi:hypothetical protein
MPRFRKPMRDTVRGVHYELYDAPNFFPEGERTTVLMTIDGPLATLEKRAGKIASYCMDEELDAKQTGRRGRFAIGLCPDKLKSILSVDLSKVKLKKIEKDKAIFAEYKGSVDKEPQSHINFKKTASGQNRNTSLSMRENTKKRKYTYESDSDGDYIPEKRNKLRDGDVAESGQTLLRRSPRFFTFLMPTPPAPVLIPPAPMLTPPAAMLAAPAPMHTAPAHALQQAGLFRTVQNTEITVDADNRCIIS